MRPNNFEKEYQLDFIRFMQLAVLPFCYLVLIGIAITVDIFFAGMPGVGKLIGLLCLLVFTVGVFVYLFMNHYRVAGKARLILYNDHLRYFNRGKEYTIFYNNISAIAVYSAWRSIQVFEITTGNMRLLITSLLISPSALEYGCALPVKNCTVILPVMPQ